VSEHADIFFILIFCGYPVAFSLGGTALIFAWIGVSQGLFVWAFMEQFPSRIFGIMSNYVLLAVPFFILMGTLLEKSKLAEDLLTSIGALFGKVRGGLALAVIFVGALLAAATGVVGASVVAMGLISLPAMMKNNYNKSLASGIVCSSGTIGQIIPPSIVLIILSDQLASASDAADNMRIENYKNVTGSTNIPSQFSVDSVSAGNMFLGAFLPGLVIVGLYMLYVLLIGIFKKEAVPPV